MLDAVTEPVLRPVRRILPPIRAGGMGIDLSIIIVILVAEIIVWCCAADPAGSIGAGGRRPRTAGSSGAER